MSVLRWTRRGMRLIVEEHADVEAAARAQALSAVTAYATLGVVEQLGDGPPVEVPTMEVRYHQARAARWHVVIRHPEHGQAVHSVHADETSAQEEAARLALLVGARRVSAVPAPA